MVNNDFRGKIPFQVVKLELGGKLQCILGGNSSSVLGGKSMRILGGKGSRTFRGNSLRCKIREVGF